MTWYKDYGDGTSERIGDDAELVEFLRDERIELTELGCVLEERFEEWVNKSFTPFEILEETGSIDLTELGCDFQNRFIEWVNNSFTPFEILENTTCIGTGCETYFTDWVKFCLMDDPDFDEVYGFGWEE